MIVSFFHHGKVSNENGGRSGGGGSVKNYLLGTDNNPREGATLILGNAGDTTEIINSIKNNKIYTSGVLSFSKEEKVTDENKFKIMQSFTDMLFPNFEQDRLSNYWVEHRDKDRLELHFVFADIDLLTGKALPVYYHGKDLGLVDSWKNITNFEYGLIDPNDPSRKRQLVPTSLTGKDEQKKQEIHDWLLSEIEQNEHIRSRTDIVKHLEKAGFEVTRQGKKENTISIKNPSGGRNLKLKGALYAPDFDRNYSLQQAVASYQDKRKQNMEVQYAKHKIELDRREKRLQQRFGHIDRTPVDTQLTRELDEIRNVGTNSFIEATHQFINEHDLSAREQDKRISDSLERANANTAIQPVGNSAFERYNSKSAERATFLSTTTDRAAGIKLTAQQEINRADGIKLTAQQEIDRANGLHQQGEGTQQLIAERERKAVETEQRLAEIHRQTVEFDRRRIADSERMSRENEQRRVEQQLAEEKHQAELQRQAQQQLAEEKRQAEQLERSNNPLYRTPKDLFKFLVNALTPRRKEVSDEKGLGNNLVAIDYAFEQYQQNKELGIYVDYSEEESYRVTKYVTNSYNLKSTAERVFLAVRSAFKPNNKSIIDDYRNIGVGEFCEKYKIDIDNKQINQYHAENPRYTLTQAQSQQSVEALTGFKMRVNFMRNNRKFKIEDLTVAEYQQIDLNSNDVIFDVKHMIWEANQIANPNLRELNRFLAENCYKTDFQKNMQQLNLKQFLDKYPINIEPKDVLAHAPKQTIQVSEPTPPVLDTPRPAINRPKPK